MPGWHRADIIAAIHKLDITLEGLGRQHGKARASMSAALMKPSRGCNLIIANTIGVPLHVLWPEWFDEQGRLVAGKANRRQGNPSTQKRSKKLILTGGRA